MKYRDLYFNPGGRLRISISSNAGLWIRWGWRAQWQAHFFLFRLPVLRHYP